AAGGALVDNFEYDLVHTPCETALASSFACFERGVQSAFPSFTRLGQLQVEGYCGLSLRGKNGAVIGLLVIMDVKPICDGEWLRSLLTMFASRASAELERARAEQERNRALADLHNIMETIPDVLFTLDLQGSLVRWNQTLERVTGYSAKELLNKHALEFVPSAEHERTASAIQQAFRDGYAELDGHLLTKDGQTIPYHWTGARLSNGEGHVIGLTGVGRDITVRKREEEEQVRREMLLSLMLSTGPGCIKRVAADGTLLSMNPAGLCMVELDERDAIGRSVFDLVVPEHRALFIDMHQAVIKGASQTLQFELQGGQGIRRWMETYAVPFRNPVTGSTEHLAVTHDITERKQMEQTLRGSEARFRSLVDNIPGAIYRCAADEHWTMAYLSDAIEQLTGYPASDFLNNQVRSYASVIHSNDRRLVEDRVHEGLDGKEPYQMEYRLLHHDGTIRWVYEKGQGVFSIDGSLSFCDGVIFDITERKRAEQLLEAENQVLALLASSHSLSDTLTFLCQSCESLSQGMLASVLLLDQDGQHLRHVASPSLPESYNRAIDGVAIGPDVGSCGTAAYLGRQVIVSDIATDPLWEKYREFALNHGLRACWSTPIIATDGQVLGAFALYYSMPREPVPADLQLINRMTNLTRFAIERKRGEQALKTSEQKLRQALLASNTGLWDWNTETGEVSFSQEWKSQLGFSEAELPDTFENWESRLHPDDRARAVAYARDYLDNPLGAFRQDFRLRHQDGTYRWIDSHASFITEPDGRRVRLLGSHTDITERKEFEAVRVRQYEALQAIFNMTVALSRASSLEEIYEQGINGVQGALKVDRASILLFDNDGVMKFKASRGLSKEYIQAVEGHSPWTREAVNPPPKSVTDIEEDPYTEAYREVFRAERIRAMSFIPLWSSDGLLGKFMLYYDTPHQFTEEELQISQTIAGHIAFMIQRKRAEEALRVSEERYARATAIGNVGVWQLDVASGQYHGDANLKALFGYGPGELSTDPFAWLGLVHPDDQPIALKNWEQIVSGATDEYHYELRMIRKDGSIIWTHVRGHANRDEAGNIVRLIGATVDITERKGAEEALRVSEERYRTLYDETPTMYFTLATDGTVRSVNRFGAELLGYCVEELVGRSVLDVYYEDDKNTVASSLSECLLVPELTQHLEFRKVRKDQTVIWVRETVRIGQSSNGETVVLVACEDVTERKLAEETLREMNIALANAMPGIARMDAQGVYTSVNDMYAAALGYDPAELIGGTWYHTVAQDHLSNAEAAYEAMHRNGKGEFEALAQRKDGSTFWKQILMVRINDQDDGRYLGYHCFMRDITERKRTEHEVNERTQQVVKMQAALLRLTHLDDADWTLSDVLPRVCEIVAETLGVARVSVWLLSENGTELVCQNLYDRSHAVHFSGSRHSTSQYPRYLEAIAASLVVAAPDALSDPRMSEFVDHYFLPLGITSMMDVPIRRQGKLVGVMWLEHVGLPRDWTHETQNFGAAVGEVLGRMMETAERKRVEVELQNSHAFMRQVIDTDPNFIFAKDRDGRFTLVNKATADVYGTTVENLLGKTDVDFNSRCEEVAQFRLIDLEVMDMVQERFILEEKITDTTGKIRWLQTVKRPLLNAQGQAVMLLGASTDITARKRVEEMLRQREQDLRAAVKERERISEDLHDGILQSIFAVGLGLESCRTFVSKRPLSSKKAASPLMAALNRAIGQLNHVMTDVRNFIAGIESHVLEEADVGETLRTMVQAMCASNGTACRVTIEEAAAHEFSTEQAYHVMNIMREALSNSLRHSGAVRITLSLKRLRRSVRLSVTDNGKGFIPEAVRDVGHGLVNMAARARKLSGRIEVRSRPRQGTKVLLDIPRRSADE
ncbi:MAG: PAS domain S-box protein, partial [Nitrospira sp.]|nr:PAS domain S-box protein [Nitrospira sp.]MBH0184651.1 PAS domain S-box protein [Nitrospira sp.]